MELFTTIGSIICIIGIAVSGIMIVIRKKNSPVNVGMYSEETINTELSSSGSRLKMTRCLQKRETARISLSLVLKILKLQGILKILLTLTRRICQTRIKILSCTNKTNILRNTLLFEGYFLCRNKKHT